MHRLSVLTAAVATCALLLALPAVAGNVSVGSPPDTTPQNHQNEPAVAVDASHPDFAVAGWNDFVDWAPCPQADATTNGTCADPADDGVGLSAVAFSFDRGKTWIQPTYTGWTASDCDPTATCAAHEGPINTLPWYYENRLVSSGDPAVAVGPIAVNGHFSWSNGSRVYYANLTGAWPSGFAFPNPEFHGYLGVGVSRLDNPTPSSVLIKSSWKPPVIVNSHTGQTAFEDKEQIWADNASSSPFFGRVYLCNPEFRSNGQHLGLGGNFPAPLTFSYSADGGDTWSTKQITAAGTPGLGPTQWGLSGCTVRTDSHGVVYVFAEMFQNPTLVGLPTHGYHVMFTSLDGGKNFTKMQIVRQITDPCFETDPVYGRCVMDGFAGARTDLSATPSIDIANGAPTGGDATNQIVDVWADGGSNINDNKALLSWSQNGGSTWSSPVTVSLAGDRPLYAAPAHLASRRPHLHRVRGRHGAVARRRHDVAPAVPRRLPHCSVGSDRSAGELVDDLQRLDRHVGGAQRPAGDVPRPRHLPGARRRLRLRCRDGELRPVGVDGRAERDRLRRRADVPRRFACGGDACVAGPVAAQ